MQFKAAKKGNLIRTSSAEVPFQSVGAKESENKQKVEEEKRKLKNIKIQFLLDEININLSQCHCE